MPPFEIPSDQLPNDYHTPVLLLESINGLAIEPAGIYVDCTFGAGGHSRAILGKLGREGKLVVFDQDTDAQRNAPEDERMLFIPQNFRHLKRFLKLHRVDKVNGILADLGVSSYQFNEADRGFSTRYDAALDMRMDKRLTRTAADIIRDYSEAQLHKIFEKYGEVTNSKTLAKTIARQRSIAPIKTISQFKQTVHPVVKGNPNKYFAQVFQALRMEVNDELEALKEMLLQSSDILKPGGRLAIISFHSLEDRVVKNFFRYGKFEEVPPDEIYGNREEGPFRVITKKPITATTEEITQNSRSRSAKLRVAEKK